MVTIVRCPACGSTEAGEDPAGGYSEFTSMVCPTCGHSSMCDHWQIKFDWNVEITLEGALPPRVAPDLGSACASCSAPALVPLPRVTGVSGCPKCRACSVNGVVLDLATSTMMRALADGNAHRAVLSSIAACTGFDSARVIDALSPEVDLAPIVGWLHDDLAANRTIAWPLLVAVVRADADASALVPHLARALEVHTVQMRAITEVLDTLCARGVDVSAACVAAKRALESDAWLLEARPNLARVCVA